MQSIQSLEKRNNQIREMAGVWINVFPVVSFFDLRKHLIELINLKIVSNIQLVT